MQPRAGRRAGGAAQLNPPPVVFDPLEAPPPPPPVQHDETSAAPSAASQGGGTTKSNAPDDGVPTWLDDPAPSTATVNSSSAPLNLPSTITKPSTGTTSSLLSTSSAPPAKLSEPNWLDDVSPATNPPPPIVVASPLLPPKAVQQSSPRLSTPSSPSHHLTASSPPTGNTTSIPAQPIIPASVGLPHSTATDSNATTIYDDRHTIVSSLERELAQLTEEHAKRAQSVAALEDLTHDDCVALHTTKSQIAFMKKQQESADDAKKKCRENHAARLANLEERKLVCRRQLEVDVKERLSQELGSKVTALGTTVTTKRSEVSLLGAQVDQKLAELQTEVNADEFATAQLRELLMLHLRNERGRLKDTARDILHQETRVVSIESSKERSEALEAERRDRMEVVKKHAAERTESFSRFRLRARESRNMSSDRLHGSLKVKMEEFTKQVRQRSMASLKNLKQRVEEDELRARRESQQALDGMTARLRTDLSEFERNCQTSEADLEKKLSGIAIHEGNVQRTEISSLERILVERVKWNPQGAFITDGGALAASSLSTVANLKERIASLANEVNQVVDVTVRSQDISLKSELQKLIHEREGVLKELRNHVGCQKDDLKRMWLRLETLLLNLSGKTEDLEKSMRNGRATLSAAQSKMDQVRTSWEAEVRRHLSEVFRTSASNDGLPLTIEDNVAGLFFDINCKLRDVMRKSKENAKSRQDFFRAQGVTTEAAQLREAAVAKATLRILETFERLSDMSAKVSHKEACIRAEEDEVRRAQEKVKDDERVFNSCVDAAKEVAERLRVMSERDDAARRTLEAQERLLEQRLKQEEELAMRQAAAAASSRSQRRSIDPTAMRRSELPSWSRNEDPLSTSKYRYLYEEQNRGGDGKGRPHPSHESGSQRFNANNNSNTSFRQEASRVSRSGVVNNETSFAQQQAAFQSLVSLETTNGATFPADRERDATSAVRGNNSINDLSLRSYHSTGMRRPASSDQGQGHYRSSSSRESQESAHNVFAAIELVPQDERRLDIPTTSSSEARSSSLSQNARRSLPTPSSDSAPHSVA